MVSPSWRRVRRRTLRRRGGGTDDLINLRLTHQLHSRQRGEGLSHMTYGGREGVVLVHGLDVGVGHLSD